MSDDAKKAAAAADRDAFLKTFESLRSELVDAERADGQVQIAIQWIDKMVEYNVPHGKLNRGLAVIDGVRALKGGAACVDDALMHQASVVGWCIEWLQVRDETREVELLRPVLRQRDRDAAADAPIPAPPLLLRRPRSSCGTTSWTRASPAAGSRAGTRATAST
jgi:hypothetical protein